jgi:hypothetical protein
LVTRDYGRIFPSTRGIFSGLCGASLLAEIAILSTLGLGAIGLVWSGVGLLLLGDYYRRYKNKLWMPRRPVLAGTAALSLGIVGYLGWIGLSQTFNRCGKLENQNSHYASSNRKVVQPTATKH